MPDNKHLRMYKRINRRNC